MLDTAQRAIQRGDAGRARALLRMLSVQYPRDRRIWLARADLAESDEERQLVLDTLAGLEPHTVVLPETAAERVPAVDATIQVNQVPPQARQPGTTPVLRPPVALTPEAAPRPGSYSPARIRWPLYLITGVAVAILAAVALLRFVVWPQPGSARLPTQPALASQEPLASVPPAEVTALPLATAAPIATASIPTPEPPTPTEAPSPTPAPTLTPRPTLAFGTVVEEGPWNATLLRPEHALWLKGSIGGLQPSGQFVLALLSIGYSGDTALAIPENLFTLEDDQGRHYRPAPGASAAYLATFGRGQYGDVSLDEVIPANAGNVSVPVIFDVPPDAHDLRLLIGAQKEGWQVPARTAP
jgi:hypothetical protein